MNKKILIPPNFYQLLSTKHLLLDTSFFIDYSIHSAVFINFVTELRANKLTFVTNVPVVTEFTKGSENTEKFAKKTAIVNSIVDYVLSISPSVFTNELSWLSQTYGKPGATCSVTDMILAAQTKIHANDLCLVTKNPSDFPASVFTLKTYFILQLERALQVYGVFCYSDSLLPKPVLTLI